MTALRLNLRADLQRRLKQQARAANQTLQAFLRDALTREVRRAELTAQESAEDVGNTFDLAATFAYHTARVSGAPSRRPKPRPARASK